MIRELALAPMNLGQWAACDNRRGAETMQASAHSSPGHFVHGGGLAETTGLRVERRLGDDRRYTSCLELLD